MAPRTSTTARTYRGKDATDRSSERRAKLVVAGHELFGTQGFHATTVKQVCGSAELTERYFYESFDNREALFAAVASDCVTGLAGSLALARSRVPNTSEAQIHAMLEAFFAWFEGDPRRARIQLFEPFLMSPDFQALYREVTALFISMVRESMLQWHEAGIARHHLAPDLIASALVGSAIESAKEWAMTDYARPRDEMVRNGAFVFGAVSRALGESTRK